MSTPHEQFAQQQQMAQYPQQQYPPALPPGYQVNPQYGQPYVQPAPAPQQPSQPLAQGTLDSFYNQRSAGGGKCLKFERIGDSHTFVVSRTVGNGDVQQQTDINDVPQFFRDGSPKFQLLVPGQLANGEEITWYVKGAARDALNDAMQAAGAPGPAPEKGAVITVTYMRDKPNGRGFNPTKIMDVRYDRSLIVGAGTAMTGDSNGSAGTAAPSAPAVAAAASPVSPAPQTAPVAAPPGVPPEQAATFAALLNENPA